MKSIGLIDAKRLVNVPARHHAEHEFCFHLHDLAVNLLVEMELKRAGDVQFEVETEEDIRRLESDIHILDFLAQSGRGDLERRAVINHICFALYADMLHFIYEALIAFEKRKFTVAFSLLRKPFKEGMLIAAQMCADEVDFFERMKTDAKNLLNRTTLDEAGIKALLSAAMTACQSTNLINPDLIYSIVFDRRNNAGFAQLFDKATHLVTEYSQIQTENYSINLIFKNPNDDDVYQNTYAQLSMLLLLLNMMQIELYSRMEHSKKRQQSWMHFTSLGTFEALFKKGRSKTVQFVNTNFDELLVCPNCDEKIRLRKSGIPKLLIAEKLDCNNCHFTHHFPFGWLWSKIGVDTLSI